MDLVLGSRFVRSALKAAGAITLDRSNVAQNVRLNICDTRCAIVNEQSQSCCSDWRSGSVMGP
jgi:hypothetical protein